MQYTFNYFQFNQRINEMSQHDKAVRQVFDDDRAGSCSRGLGIFQIALGVLLMTASAFGYSLLQHPAVLVPAMMGAVLFFTGGKSFMVCRTHLQNHSQHHPSNGMTS